MMGCYGRLKFVVYIYMFSVGHHIGMMTCGILALHWLAICGTKKFG